MESRPQESDDDTRSSPRELRPHGHEQGHRQMSDENRREKPPALPPPRITPEPLSLSKFIEKYSKYLPALVSVQKGHYGSNDPETLGSQEKLIISFVKSRKVLNIVTSTKQKFALPLGSAIQLHLLYNPEGNEEKARKGYVFKSIGEIVKKFPGNLPRVICATKAFRGDCLKSSVHENEVLIVERYNTQTKGLEVKSHSSNPISKFLPDQCEGKFTTEPSKVCLYTSDINTYIGTPLSILELQAILDLNELASLSPDTQIDKSLNGIVTLSGFVTERSLVGKRIEDIKGVPSTQSKPFEIPVNDNLCSVELTVINTNVAMRYPSSTTIDAPLEFWYQEEVLPSTKTQRLLDDWVRHGHERDGIAINADCNVYEELSTHSPPQTRDSNLHQLQLQSQHSGEVDHSISSRESDPDGHSSLPVDDAGDQHMHIPSAMNIVGVTRSDLETTIRSVLSDFMGEKQPRVLVQSDRCPSFTEEDGADPIDKVKLNDVVMELSEIETLWYMFGILLGIPKPKLDQIQANYGSGPSPHGRCLIETICLWKDNNDKATWSSIVQALYSMQKKQLAKRVAAKHNVIPDPREFPHDQFTKQLKEFIPEDTISEISSRQQQMQKQDESLNEVQESLNQYEQRMEDNQKSLMTIKDHLQFNERFTRMLIRENQVLRMKLAHKEQLFKSPSHEARKSKDKQTSQENLKKEIHTLQDAQKSHESRLNVAHHDTMELKKQLLSIEEQMEMTKKQLHSLQDQKHKLTRGLREQERELSHIITGSLNHGSREDDDLPQYYNIIRCDGKVEVKLHKEELAMLQQDLERKTEVVGSLKKELQQKHEQMSRVESRLAKQQDDVELMYTYTDGAENIVLKKHENDHLKTRLQMERIDCQIQLTRALLQKKDIESKLETVKQSLELSEKICQEAQELYQRSTSASSKNSRVPLSSRTSNRSTSLSSTTSEDSDVFVVKSTSISGERKSKESRPRKSTPSSGTQKSKRTCSDGSIGHGAHLRRYQANHGQAQRPSHKTQVKKTD